MRPAPSSAIPTILTAGASTPDTLLELARQRAGKGLLLVDKSFADLEGGGLSLAPHLPQRASCAAFALQELWTWRSPARLRARRSPRWRPRSAPRSDLGPCRGRPSRSEPVALADRAWRDAARQQLAQDVTRTRWDAARGGLGRHWGNLAVPSRGKQSRFGPVSASWRGGHSRARLRLSPRLAPLRHPWQRG